MGTYSKNRQNSKVKVTRLNFVALTERSYHNLGMFKYQIKPCLHFDKIYC